MKLSEMKSASAFLFEPSVVVYFAGIATVFYSHFVLDVSGEVLLFFLLIVSDLFGLVLSLLERKRIIFIGKNGLIFVCVSALIWPLYLFSNDADSIGLYKSLLVYFTVVLSASFCLAQQGFLYWFPIVISVFFVLLKRDDVFGDELAIGCVIFSMYLLLLMSNIAKSVRDVGEAKITLENELKRRVYFESVSQYDFLTGAGNRLRLYQLWPSLWVSGCVFFALLDIDHFKKINDTYGHGFGDDVLKKFCLVIRDQLGEGDEVIRLGGEEFLVVMTNCRSKEDFLMILDEISRSTKLEFDDVLSWDFTFSVGYGRIKNSAATNRVLEALDVALYKAKRSGRNCTVEAFVE